MLRTSIMLIEVTMDGSRPSLGKLFSWWRADNQRAPLD
jgi:hypothetical protein